MRKILYLLILLQIADSIASDEYPRLELSLPVDCDVGTSCFIQNLFDHDPGPGFRDYKCGAVGYDGHKGTDIRLPNLAVMQQGVVVKAAADGRVRAIRDEMPDIGIRESGRLSAVKGREAGNSVAIVHGNGWETQYSHMKLGSVTVKPGQEVRSGQPIGLIGLSGKTEFPHLHISVRHKGKPIDPFVGLERSSDCGPGRYSLWNERAFTALTYPLTALLQAGFAQDKPELAAVEAGEYDVEKLPPTASALVFWVEVVNAQQGDRESLGLEAPDGSVLVSKKGLIPENKARWFRYIGKKRRQQHWPAGIYRAHYRLERGQSENRRRILDVNRTIMIR